MLSHQPTDSGNLRNMVIPEAAFPIANFTPAERRLIRRLDTPRKVQRFLNRLPYNTEPKGDTLRSFREVRRRGTAHCLEAALAAACILEQHGYPPLVMSLASADKLDHVIFVYQSRGRWGAVARSRDPGLHGRKPLFRSLRALAESYCDPYIDYTGRLTGFAAIDLRVMGGYDWRLSRRNVWAAEHLLLRLRHKPIRRSGKRTRRLRAQYRAYLAKHNKKPLYYAGRDRWTEIPAHFR
jgi:hypothetical protein